MIQLELPHITILTKADLINDKSILENLNELNPDDIINDCDGLSGNKMKNLTKALIEMVLYLINFNILDRELFADRSLSL